MIRLIPFEFSIEQTYQCEFGHKYIAFLAHGGRVQRDGRDYIISSPYSKEDLYDLQYYQINDVLYLVCGKYQPRKLSRISADEFKLEAMNIEDGPFDDENTDDEFTLTPSGIEGNINLVSSKPLFSSLHAPSAYNCGALFKISHSRPENKISAIFNSRNVNLNVQRIAFWDRYNWIDMADGFDNEACASAVHSGSLYVGGKFAKAGNTAVNRIAQWDSSANSWQAVGQGFNNTVYSLCSFDNKLYAAGQFTSADGQTANRIAVWDGDSWQPVGQGFNNTVYALCVYNDSLYACGSFTKSGTTTVSRIAKWNGSAWQSVGSGLNGTARAMTVFDDKLVIGGQFTVAGGSSAGRVTGWNGTSFSTYGYGFNNNEVYALIEFGGSLYAGGSFTKSGTVDILRFAKWTGSAWQQVGQGFNNTVFCFSQYDSSPSYLAIGGMFTKSGSAAIERAASFDGTSISSIGREINNTILSMSSITLSGITNALVICGAFTKAVGEDEGAFAVSDILEVDKGSDWKFTTSGRWTATISLQRSYDNGLSWTTIHSCTSENNNNSEVDGKEKIANALYRIRISSYEKGSAVCALAVLGGMQYGIVRITEVASETEASAVVLKKLIEADATNKWAEGFFSDENGWPVSVAISKENRLVLAGSKRYPLTVWGSVIDGYSSFRQGVLDDDSYTVTLTGSDRQNAIKWIVQKDELIIGTGGAEYILKAAKQEAVTPTNINIVQQTRYGSESIQPVLIGESLIFVQRGGRRIFDFIYDFAVDSFAATDLTRLAGDILSSGVKQIAAQLLPEPILWCVLNNGKIAGLTYSRKEEVAAWFEIVTDGSFKSISVTSSTNSDDVYAAVERTVDGIDRIYIEQFASFDINDIKDSLFLDSALVYEGQAVSEVAGLEHLEGRLVTAVADGVFIEGLQVKNGAISLHTPASKIIVGLPYYGRLMPMKITFEQIPPTLIKRVPIINVRLYKSYSGLVGDTDRCVEPIAYDERALFTGDKQITVGGSYERNGDLIIMQTKPMPLNLLGIIAQVNIHDD